jgi:Spy/CpxP family protein refolding chaperone
MHKLLIALSVVIAAPALAQHGSHAPGPSSFGRAASYAGEEAREIKALSAQEQRAWLEGEGSGLARAAELNGHPGPMHVLEHASELGLSEVQREKTREMMQRHKAQVRELGAQLVAAERRLDELFRSRQATRADVDVQTQLIAGLQGRIRASHLGTHLEQTALLQPDQIAAYERLRGYRR